MDCRVKPGNDDYRLSFRDGPKDQTRNLEILRCAIPLHVSMLRIAPEGRLALNQPAAVGDAAEVIVGVAKTVFDHGQALEVVADLGFHGHADAAMQLDRLLAAKLH